MLLRTSSTAGMIIPKIAEGGLPSKISRKRNEDTKENSIAMVSLEARLILVPSGRETRIPAVVVSPAREIGVAVSSVSITVVTTK